MVDYCSPSWRYAQKIPHPAHDLCLIVDVDIMRSTGQRERVRCIPLREPSDGPPLPGNKGPRTASNSACLAGLRYQ